MAEDEGAERLPRKDESQQLLEESRMILPGTQALAGFQFIAVLNEGFARLPPAARMLHVAALVLVMLSMSLLMAPAAYHRIAERHLVSDRFIALASRLITAAMGLLAIGISIEIAIAAWVALDRALAPALALAVLFFGLCVGLWFVFPLRRRVPPRPD